ncbi:biotin--protein ligase [Pseudorasbora parva]|uniref:biotin--protein ligase n=1 Tax=Pseudorasbora parva TaxID=51549 RepID=UPI00351E684E
MLITLCYIYLWLRFQRYYTAAIRAAIHRLSGGRRSVTFRALSREWSVRSPQSPSDGALFLELGDKGVYITEPQACEDLSKWTLLGSSLAGGQRLESVAFIIEATSRVPASPHQSEKAVLNWSDYCLPLACSPGQPYRAVAEASLENFSRLGVAFMEDRLRMENGLIPEKIVSVCLRESAVRDLLEEPEWSRKSSLRQEEPERSRKSSLCPEEPERSRKSSLCPEEPERSRKSSLCPEEPERLRKSSLCPEEPERLRKSSLCPEEPEHMDGHHLHLSSCHECLELENSTILSVRFASAENIPDLPDDGPDEDNIPDLPDESVRLMGSGKPPNVLVFTGGCELQFQRIRSLLAEVLDPERYTIYPLRPQPALSEPWPENTLLLVLATEQTLTPQLQLRFLSYLSQGGKLLGLSCSLCPAGLILRPRTRLKDRICRLSFTRADSAELQLSVVSSGRVYDRSGDRAEADVEVWGEIGMQDQQDRGGAEAEDQREMAIVRLTHGADSGEAVLCQVLWPGDEPVLVDGELVLPDGEQVFHTEPPQTFSEHFSLQTYRQNLGTEQLGRTIIYADVTSSTMDLLNRFVLQSPQEVGLIAIAARQTQGKGRGGNAWLSPLGCAMFSLHLQVPLNSRLGQRLPFLQHLAALAVVQSVRTLPGYEDLDLRLKWPNDIYYSHLMKLGGVLVNSSLTGQTFSLLIGCGFNVSNSNPTVCINDLVRQQRRHGGDLEPLQPEQLIARSISLLERYISDFQQRGPQELLPLYYSRWVHGGARVRLWSEDGPEAEVVGLDENGFLQVRSGDQLESVQPDGNSFDMLRNLVVIKSR